MAWIKLSEELYLSDQSPYSLEKIDGIWYVVDNSTQKKSIPFVDIFNNPVFPIDYSNTDMLVKSLTSTGTIEGKHFRGESANTPATPAFSFQGDIDTGFFRKSANVMGISSGGVEVSEINNFGILNGTPGTDFRNLIKITTAQLTRLASPTLSASTTSTTHVSSGVGFLYSAINPNSKLRITFQIPINVVWNGNSILRTAYFRTYVDTVNVPAMGNLIPGTSTQINLAENFIGSAYNDSISVVVNGSWLYHTVEFAPGTINQRYYYISFRVEASTISFNLLTSNINNYAQYTVEECL